MASPQLLRSVYFWTAPGGDGELIHRLIAEDAELQAARLINFLGTPQGQLIADAVTEATIPEPWATLIREELTLLAEQQRGVRQQQIGQEVGIGLIATAVSLFLYGIFTATRPAPAAA